MDRPTLGPVSIRDVGEIQRMPARRSLRLPIALAVVMILMLLVLTVGWVIMAVRSALDHAGWAPLYWTFLSVGSTFFVLILVGVVLYMTFSIKAINITRRQSNFIDSVTHELKSPIASLKLYLQTLVRSRCRAKNSRSSIHECWTMSSGWTI